ncbi:nitroreductase family deazaflavin-dependent oxidoreductase [Cellulomonas edaphi]|uniref:Nitroreductase family deazaflavin-dependent oxidoreductase n=1 Tax=Cellulomonas edaphi TaxID=3053468 RepID=A0ABT7S9M9_9CELL|nr:nitroreductase family deazaflavin-dependent oxidoreductase [Cellulomons edaphi]MDM7832325.1 nitroreductase family deazaflavin-dependent oxidoreductase [Cellulomons edaphi]
MTAPHWVTRVNLRFTNKLMVLLSDDVPPLATLHHVGRRSGRRYRTPLMAFPTERGFVFALTYGPDVQWLHNLESGPGRLVQRRRVYALSDPRTLTAEDGRALVPSWTARVLRLLRCDDFVELAAVRV